MGKKALVVDNDLFFVEFLAELLEDRGYDVIKAYDGQEGISRLDQGPVSFIFVDVVMPKMGGKEFIETARKKYPDARFPIIAVSGTITDKMETVNELGADYYIAKGPMEKMAEQIKAFLENLESQI